jgi:hypothetical protein
VSARSPREKARLVAIAVVFALALSLAAGRCGRDVGLGVAPPADAAADAVDAGE